MKLTPVGIDLAKNVFQLHYVDEETGEVTNRSIRRGVFLEHFANRSPCLIGMEAGSGAHHWARQLTRMGHQIKLMQGRYVKAFNIRNKNDAADAQAIWLAVQQPGKSVAVKTEMQQAMPAVLSRLSEILPAVLIESLREQWEGITRLDKRIDAIERRMQEWKKDDTAVRAISEIPGVGLLSATAAIATMGDAKSFRSGREFAAWIGLVPRQTGSGGKTRLHGISKRGDTYLRTLLIHGARSVVTNAKSPRPWVEEMKKRKPLNVAVVALANKMARMIWAILAHGRVYEKGYVSMKPA